jgi:hypothetical protein
MLKKSFWTASAVAFAASLGACAEPGGYRDYGGTGSDSTTYASSETDVVYVDEGTYPSRTYFYEPSDVQHVYYYEDGRPDVVVYRPTYVNRGRRYYVEYDRGVERRVFFNDRRAREHRLHHSWHDRERRLRDARDRDADRVRDWRRRHDRWERDHRGDDRRR